MSGFRSHRRGRAAFQPWLLELETRVVPSFVGPRSFDAGGNPFSVAVGDFSGDGIPDLAVVGGDQVNVLLGNGDGSFQAARSFTAGDGPISVAVGDFNGDGWPDLAVANFYSNDVSILLNNGAGTGPHAGRNGGAPRGGHFPDRSASVLLPTLRPPAAVEQAQLAEAAFPDLGRAAPDRAVADAAPALPRPEVTPAPLAAPVPEPRKDDAPTRARSAALWLPPRLLDLVFADALDLGSDGRLVGDRGMLLA